jgi:Protein of unknown function with HXXEE motif
MEGLITAFAISCTIQIIHSLEEIITRFDRRWPLWQMKRSTFISFETLFTLLFLSVLFISLPFQEIFAKTFLLSMFANGIWHIFWAGSEKRYVPGLITAPLHVINSAFFFLL